jgi:phosphatidylinositol-3-phosphatase
MHLCSDLKMLEVIHSNPDAEVQNLGVSVSPVEQTTLDGMSATYGPSSSNDAGKRTILTPTVSSSALLQGSTSRPSGNRGWKRGVMDRATPVPSTNATTPNHNASTLRNRMEPDSGEEDILMQTLMPERSSTVSSSSHPPSLLSSGHRTLRPSASRGIDGFDDLDEDEYDDDMDLEEEVEELDESVLINSTNQAALMPAAETTTTINASTSPGSSKMPPSALLGPPPKIAASTPPFVHTPPLAASPPPTSPKFSTSSSSSSSSSLSSHISAAASAAETLLTYASSSSSGPIVPTPPQIPPQWFDKLNSEGDTSSTTYGIISTNFSSSSSSTSSPIEPGSAKMMRKGRARAANVTNRLTYAGTNEEVGLVRRAELARLPLPNFRKDYHVSILIQYSDNSKEVIEYKNRVHPECLSSDIIAACVLKTKKKIPSWNPPADKFVAFELIIPAKNDDDDDIVMDLDIPIYKYCFAPGDVTRLVMRLKMRFDSTRIALKIRLDRGPLRNMMFHTITPVAMVIERIQHKIKGSEQKGPPFTGLFVFDNKRGRFLENVNKTLADYRLKNMDIIQVKRRRLMELCLRDQPKKNLMVPLDLTASLLAEQLHDWLRLDPIDPSSNLSLVKIVPKRGNMAEMQLVLHPTTEVRAFHLMKDDVFQLRKRVGIKLDQAKNGAMTSSNASQSPQTNSAASSTSQAIHMTQSNQSAASSLSLGNGMILGSPKSNVDSRLAKSGSHQIYIPGSSNDSSSSSSSSSSASNHSPSSSSHHASIKFPTTTTTQIPSSEVTGTRSHVADTMGTVVATFQVAFAGNSHDSESFGSGVSMQNAFVSGRTRRYPPPKLKIGEVGLFQTVYSIYLWDSSTRISMLGDVHITNYRLVFSSYSDDTMTDYHVDVPLTTISRVEKTGDKSKPGLKVDCKDFRTLRFHFERSGKDNRRQMRRLLEDCLYPNFRQLFALAYKSSMPSDHQRIDGWTILDLRKEFQRLGVVSEKGSSRWRISTLNETYAFSKTYPSLIVVPASISDEELIPVFKYRSKGRLPALSWLNSRTGASITRCSQPLSGMTKKTSPDDANLINAIKEAQGSADAKLHLLDARPRANAIANMAMGGGFEVMGGSAYSGCDLEFLNIGNIHVMRNSLSDLKSLLESQPYDNSFLARMEASGWLLHISLILQGSVKIVEHIQQRHSCVLHCSDGWDRTSQLSSVAMLLLDPYYRTIKGLCILIEKEWCTFGHKFASRYGHIAVDHVDKNYAHGERAPIFLQFIDCVYQIIRQFPLAFEFNEAVLLCILEHLYSCHYGTFLFDCERERKIEDLANKTESLWTYILDPTNMDKFKNIFYEPFDSVLPLAPTLADVHIWRAYYRRWYAPPDEDKISTEERVRTLVANAARQADRIAQLELRLSAHERQ